ncbi:MAG TPA: MBL fold metallo-hydrolase, partial [Gaiellaceae bacterium]|nr:MBL fold metallo-hydrolase [Gaiellaceae bacterium]
MLFRQFVDDDLGCASYLIGDEDTGEAVVVDPAYAIEQYLEQAEADGVRIVRVLETHTHADHLSAADHVKQRTRARTGTGAHVGEVQKTWAEIYNLEPGFRT